MAKRQAIPTGSANRTTATGDNVVILDAPNIGCAVQNNSSSTIYVEEDTVATQGSYEVGPGDSYQTDDPLNAIHFYAPSGIGVNASASGGIVVRVFLPS